MRTVDWRTLWEEHAEPGELRRVLSALSNSMGGSGGQPPTNCSPSMERIARRAGMRRDSASKWIRTAEQEGWINVGRIQGLRNRYYATVPKSLAGLIDEGRTVQSKRPKAEREATGAVESATPRCPDHPDAKTQRTYSPKGTGGMSFTLSCSECWKTVAQWSTGDDAPQPDWAHT